MAQKGRKRKVRIKVKQAAQLVHKNDKTRVAKDTSQTYRSGYSPTPMPHSQGAVFKVKLRKK